MNNVEVLTLAISVATLMATIAACIIASQISKNTARNTIIHYINTTVIRWMNLMEEVSSIKDIPNCEDRELMNKYFFDSIEIQNIGMALSLEASGKTYLKRRQLKAIDSMLTVARDFWAMDNKE